MARLPHEIAAHLRNEARHLQVAEAVGDEHTAAYATDCLEAAEAIEKMIADLAQCYRLSGADTDGNEDWRIAPHAVEEAARMRQGFDETDEALLSARDKIARLTFRIAELEREAHK